MRRPWIEASPLLASRTLDATALPPPAPQIAPGIRFALLERPTDARSKPRAWPDARRLARWIARRRAGRRLQLETRRQRLREGVTHRGVAVWAIDRAGDREFLGWAWLSGQGQVALEDALHAFDRKGVAR